jgi:hypothetical protein
LWTDNWVCSKFPAGEPAEAFAAALREREFTILGADPIVGPQRNLWDTAIFYGGEFVYTPFWARIGTPSRMG